MNVNGICVHRSLAITAANAVNLVAQLLPVNVPNNSTVNFARQKSTAVAFDRIVRMVEHALRHPIKNRFVNAWPIGTVNFVRFDKISALISHARVANA